MRRACSATCLAVEELAAGAPHRPGGRRGGLPPQPAPRPAQQGRDAGDSPCSLRWRRPQPLPGSGHGLAPSLRPEPEPRRPAVPTGWLSSAVEPPVRAPRAVTRQTCVGRSEQ